MEKTHFEGKDRGEIVLYGLSTCGWCGKTKNFLKRVGIGFHYIDVDTLKIEDKKDVMVHVKKHNPRCSFPTLIVNDSKCIVGYDEKKILEAVKDE